MKPDNSSSMTTEANTKFLASYFHRGSWWCVEIFAVDWDDAETICRKLSLRLDGEHYASLPTVTGPWFARLDCSITKLVLMTERTLQDALTRAESLRDFKVKSPKAFARSDDFQDVVNLADEIERLRTENAELQKLYDSTPYT